MESFGRILSSFNSLEKYPKLRFPSFTEPWEVNKLNELTYYRKGKASVPKNKYISTENMQQDFSGINIFSTQDIVSGIAFFNGDILMANIRPYLKKIWCATFDGACSTDVLAISSTNNINRNFLYFALAQTRFIDYVMSGAKGSKMPRGDKDHIMQYELTMPSYKEQEEISAFLFALNRKIKIQQQLIDLLKKYKRGLMMHIFKKKLKTSFFDSEEWETKPFTSIFTTISDKPYQIQTNEYKLNGNYEVVDQGKKAIVGYNDDKSKLFTEVPIIIYGDHTTIIKYRKTPFIVGGDGVKLITNYSDNNLGYLYYALSFCNIKQEGYKRHYSILKNISLPIPSIKTQERIYSLLSMLDKKIDNYNTYLIKLCELKMSLLQQMFI